VVKVVVAAKASHHGERVRRSLQELGQHQIVELETRSPGGLHAQIARLGIDAIGRLRQYGRRRDVGRRRTLHELGAPRVPLRGAFVGMADAQDRRLAERPADDLHAEREAVPAEAVGKRQHGLAAVGVRRAYQGGFSRNRPAASAWPGTESGVMSAAARARSLAAASRQDTQSAFEPSRRPQAAQVRVLMA